MRRIIRRREILEDSLRYAGEPQGPGTVSVQTAAEWIAGAGSASGMKSTFIVSAKAIWPEAIERTESTDQRNPRPMILSMIISGYFALYV